MVIDNTIEEKVVPLLVYSKNEEIPNIHMEYEQFLFYCKALLSLINVNPDKSSFGVFWPLVIKYINLLHSNILSIQEALPSEIKNGNESIERLRLISIDLATKCEEINVNLIKVYDDTNESKVIEEKVIDMKNILKAISGSISAEIIKISNLVQGLKSNNSRNYDYLVQMRGWSNQENVAIDNTMIFICLLVVLIILGIISYIKVYKHPH